MKSQKKRQNKIKLKNFPNVILKNQTRNPGITRKPKQ